MTERRSTLCLHDRSQEYHSPCDRAVCFWRQDFL